MVGWEGALDSAHQGGRKRSAFFFYHGSRPSGSPHPDVTFETPSCMCVCVCVADLRGAPKFAPCGRNVPASPSLSPSPP